MRKVWKDIAVRKPLESDNKLPMVTYHSWFACPLLDLRADSRTRVRNGGVPLMPPQGAYYLHLDLPEHVPRHVSRFRLQAHTAAVKSFFCCGGNGSCDK